MDIRRHRDNIRNVLPCDDEPLQAPFPLPSKLRKFTEKHRELRERPVLKRRGNTPVSKSHLLSWIVAPHRLVRSGILTYFAPEKITVKKQKNLWQESSRHRNRRMCLPSSPEEVAGSRRTNPNSIPIITGSAWTKGRTSSSRGCTPIPARRPSRSSSCRPFSTNRSRS